MVRVLLPSGAPSSSVQLCRLAGVCQMTVLILSVALDEYSVFSEQKARHWLYL
jgi:hypothetical protein